MFGRTRKSNNYSRHQRTDRCRQQPGVLRGHSVGFTVGREESLRSHRRPTTADYVLPVALRAQAIVPGRATGSSAERPDSASYTDSEGNTRTSLKLEPRYENAGDLVHKLVELDADPQAVRAGIKAAGITSFGSLENLVNAYATIHRHLKDNYDDAAQLRKYWGYLANKVVFIQISTDVSSALKIFETINERGVGLNPMDLLKNLLFTNVRLDQFTQLKDEWKKITKPLEKAKEKPLRFLRYFLMANYVIRNERRDAVVREDEIYDWFVDKQNAALCDYRNRPFEFVRKIIRDVDHYLGVH